MPKDLNQDVAAIKQWLAKEPYLPNDLEELMLKKFLHSCYGSLEQTKKCIEKFFVTRSAMTELYTGRDPLSPRIKTAFSITCSLSVNPFQSMFNSLDRDSYWRFPIRSSAVGCMLKVVGCMLMHVAGKRLSDSFTDTNDIVIPIGLH
ncbi:hypothetical protein EVAR_25039_1 [Eumeta japonica]|uniref:Uncharacterized protein n=1 Tax=Eumeta variegata TaxID=151549 RepID=A0A4C1V7I4_EUMVA|nr:hypothetical protein EVAR_25039_1 [Eumeta japonica]